MSYQLYMSASNQDVLILSSYYDITLSTPKCTARFDPQIACIKKLFIFPTRLLVTPHRAACVLQRLLHRGRRYMQRQQNNMQGQQYRTEECVVTAKKHIIPMDNPSTQPRQRYTAWSVLLRPWLASSRCYHSKPNRPDFLSGLQNSLLSLPGTWWEGCGGRLRWWGFVFSADRRPVCHADRALIALRMVPSFLKKAQV